MAVIFGTSDALTKKIWSAKLYKESMKDMFFEKFTGEGPENIIQVNMELKKEKGDKVTFGLIMDMTEDGQESATGITLEGNEEDIVTHDFYIELLEFGHATKAKSLLDLQRPVLDLRKEMLAKLKIWRRNRLETKIITALSDTPTSNRIINGATGEPASGVVLTKEMISAASRMADGATPKIMPILIGGKKHFVLLATPLQIKSLRADTDFMDYNSGALPRDAEKNPIWTGKDYVWDNVLIFKYERCLTYSNNVARALLLGAQAGGIAYGNIGEWHEKLFDYDTIPGVGVKGLWGIKKTAFNGEDFGVIAIDTKYVSD